MSPPIITVTVPALSKNLTSLDAVKQSLAITDFSQDDFLQSLISRASGVIVGACGRSFGLETLVETIRWTRRATQRISSGRMEGPPILLSRRPVSSVASIIEYGNAVPLVENTDFEVDQKAGMIYRLSGQNRVWWTTASVNITYSAGYSLPDDGVAYTLPRSVEDVCISMVAGGYSLQALNPGIKTEVTEGVGRTDYFDRGFATFTLDDSLKSALAPFINRPW